MSDHFGETGRPEPWDDFLASTDRPLDHVELEQFRDKRVLITGAGGFLGSSLARALAELPIRSMVLLDQSEYGLYQLQQAIPETPKTTVLVGSVLDSALLRDLFRRYKPEWVLHAAALKHVPMMENNPFTAAQTNVLGTQAVVEASRKAGAERILLLSTDKAVDPINVMGATKRIAEQIMLRAAQKGSMLCVIARLCNVLGATGSVAPLFARQVLTGGPVTVTNAEATRFFLSRVDATRFLLRSISSPTESGLVLPEVSQASRVWALAQHLIGRLGQSEGSIEIVETGLRVGDKLHEHLLSAAEAAVAGQGSKWFPADALETSPYLEESLQHIEASLLARDLAELFAAIQLVVPTYKTRSGEPVHRKEA